MTEEQQHEHEKHVHQIMVPVTNHDGGIPKVGAFQLNVIGEIVEAALEAHYYPKVDTFPAPGDSRIGIVTVLTAAEVSGLVIITDQGSQVFANDPAVGELIVSAIERAAKAEDVVVSTDVLRNDFEEEATHG